MNSYASEDSQMKECFVFVSSHIYGISVVFFLNAFSFIREKRIFVVMIGIYTALFSFSPILRKII